MCSAGAVACLLASCVSPDDSSNAGSAGACLFGEVMPDIAALQYVRCRAEVCRSHASITVDGGVIRMSYSEPPP